MTYNVENYFYPNSQKAAHIAEVMAAASDTLWQMPAVVCLQEVERDSCLIVLCKYHLRQHHYDWRLYEGSDARGIDVALLYDSTRVRLLRSYPVQIPIPPGEKPVREALYAAFATEEDTFHIVTCHLPSQRGGAAATDSRREAAFRGLQLMADSLLRVSSEANILVLGDMNTAPREQLLPLQNRMMGMAGGTEKYRGRWNMLDQVFTTPSLVPRSSVHVFSPAFLLEEDKQYGGMKPKRMSKGEYNRKSGYSDHLPVIVEIW